MTKKAMTKQAMIQILIAEELKAWNSLMFNTWFHGEDSKEAAASHSAWSVLSTTLFQLGISEYQGAGRRSTITLPKTA
jgi:hypothetical protein